MRKHTRAPTKLQTPAPCKFFMENATRSIPSSLYRFCRAGKWRPRRGAILSVLTGFENQCRGQTSRFTSVQPSASMFGACAQGQAALPDNCGESAAPKQRKQLTRGREITFHVDRPVNCERKYFGGNARSQTCGNPPAAETLQHWAILNFIPTGRLAKTCVANQTCGPRVSAPHTTHSRRGANLRMQNRVHAKMLTRTLYHPAGKE